MTRMATRMALACVAGSAVAAGTLGGCASYETYPAVPQNIALNDPNTLAMESVMGTGLRWVVQKYPPDDASIEDLATGRAEPAPFAINLPQGTNYRTYERIAEAVGRRALPLSADSSHLPIYHVSYVRVRGDEAQLHVIRPVGSLGVDATGKAIPQEIKLQLRGGVRPWRVISSREWQVGAAELPPLTFYTPPPERAEPAPSRPQESAFVPNPQPRTASAPEGKE